MSCILRQGLGGDFGWLLGQDADANKHKIEDMEQGESAVNAP